MRFPGENPGRMVFETASLKNLVTLKGSRENPVRNVTLEGLAFVGFLSIRRSKYLVR